MSLQNVVLSPLLINDLYKDLFIIADEFHGKRQITGSNEPDANRYAFLGNNEKRVVLVVRHRDETFLPDRHLEFLTKILGACKLNIGDVAIVNEGMKQIDINSIRSQLRPKQVLLFGIDPTEIKLPLTFPAFKPQDYAGCTYLQLPSLDILNNSSEEGKLLKTKLWVCLKTMFEVDSRQ